MLKALCGTIPTQIIGYLSRKKGLEADTRQLVIRKKRVEKFIGRLIAAV